MKRLNILALYGYYKRKVLDRILLRSNAAVGYRNVMDPANGFTVIHRQVFEQLALDILGRGFSSKRIC